MRHGHPLNSARRRARKVQLARRHGQRCTYCRRPFTELREATLDHIVPQSLFRTWSVVHLVLACRACNQAKADRLPLSIALLLLWSYTPAAPGAAVDWPLLARLAAARQDALTSVTTRVTPGVTPRPVDRHIDPRTDTCTPARSMRDLRVRTDCEGTRTVTTRLCTAGRTAA
ncbi:HNH endonuclease [Streptomyces sp. TRM49041]|uniref:HNH endonuclease n=1 Tax=Streptomyces sp. TRM49041 TaxID=2603216 RepID=UPI0021CD13FC|nr:HNH endonuclease [Streptomyces sp. TRM49041]